MESIYLLIDHCNGEIISRPFIVKGLDKLNEYIYGEYIIYEIVLPELKIIEIK